MHRVPFAQIVFTLVVLPLGSLILGKPLLAANVYTYTSTGGDQGQDTIELLIDGPNMSMDDTVKGGLVFRSEEEYMAILDHKDKQYVHLSIEQMEQLAGQINPAMDAMRKQIEQLPPEQREMMKKMMGSRVPQTQKETRQIELSIAATDESGIYAGFDCKWWEMRRDSELVRSACVADTGDIPNGVASLNTLRGMAAYQKKLLKAFDQLPMAPSTTIFEEMQRIDGFPVATRDFKNGVMRYETRLTSIADRETSAADFAPPAGYTERALTGPQ